MDTESFVSDDIRPLASVKPLGWVLIGSQSISVAAKDVVVNGNLGRHGDLGNRGVEEWSNLVNGNRSDVWLHARLEDAQPIVVLEHAIDFDGKAKPISTPVKTHVQAVGGVRRVVMLLCGDEIVVYGVTASKAAEGTAVSQVERDAKSPSHGRLPVVRKKRDRPRRVSAGREVNR